MCITSIAFARLEGRAEGPIGWFPLTHAAVCNDHPHHAELEWCINIDCVNEQLGPSARAAFELTLESARAIGAALIRVAKDTAELENPTTKRSGAKPVTSTGEARMEGSAKGVGGWFTATNAYIRNGHPLNAELEWCVVLEAVNSEIGQKARVGLEITVESAKALGEAIMKVVRETDDEEAQYAAEVAAKGLTPRPPER